MHDIQVYTETSELLQKYTRRVKKVLSEADEKQIKDKCAFDRAAVKLLGH